MCNTNNEFMEGPPVPCFPIKFKWQTNWFEIFEKHVELIQQDIERARAEDRVIVYLSCPISGLGGGYHGTNVEIANHTARRLMMEWGPRFWILNPCQYQMESKEGTGLIRRHVQMLKLEEPEDKQIQQIDIESLKEKCPPTGGDYMRMWTRVLVEDDEKKNLGGRFDAFHFVGPSDVWHFFRQGRSTTLTACIEEYFARKFTMDSDFREHFSPPFKDKNGKCLSCEQEAKEWEQRRKDFFRFYAIRASVNFSKGCHDEWNIWRTLNELRIENLGIGSQIAGYFEGKQIEPAAAESGLTNGYALKKKGGN